MNLNRLNLFRPAFIKQCANYCSFKSSLSLDKLYPQSTLNIAKPVEIPKNGEDTFSGFIPMDKIEVKYSKSSGPGGMNVNKNMTKVDVRFKLDSANWIPDSIRKIVETKLKSMVSREGYFVIQSDRTRYAHMNLADALQKIRECIRSCEPAVAAVPTPDTLEKVRRRRERQVRERLMEKRERSNVKANRGSSGDF